VSKQTARQLAIVRTVADALERCLASGHPGETLRTQLFEEVSRLGPVARDATSDLGAAGHLPRGGLRDD
jgi:hypothetical protein